MNLSLERAVCKQFQSAIPAPLHPTAAAAAAAIHPTHLHALVKHNVHELLVGLDAGEGDADDGALAVARQRLDEGRLAGACIVTHNVMFC